MAKIPALSTALLVILLVTAATGVAKAQQIPPFPVASTEYSFLVGYGITHRGLGETRTEVQTVDFVGRFGYFLSDEFGVGWYRGQFEHVLELPIHLVVDPKTRVMIGGNLLAKWNFTGLVDDRLLPYLFAGGGLLYVDLGLPSMGSRLDFSYGGGTGLQYLVREDMAISAEYRYHHISNASTAQPNEPLNSSKLLFGISLFR
ncbi:MAG: lipid A 3-O-deacylase [Geobacteraceae bacterium GWC2_58_44]|nr:MAG: lipid A 3-O-deacylase [Geobacteraceae bacterium GWC2_58_44]HBG06478.1 acyloxyacyl hydrolase [Geobacter sp.]